MSSALKVGMGLSMGAKDQAAARCAERGGEGRATIGRDQADQDVGIGQVGALGHVDDVGQGHQAAAEADRGAGWLAAMSRPLIRGNPMSSSR